MAVRREKHRQAEGPAAGACAIYARRRPFDGTGVGRRVCCSRDSSRRRPIRIAESARDSSYDVRCMLALDYEGTRAERPRIEQYGNDPADGQRLRRQSAGAGRLEFKWFRCTA